MSKLLSDVELRLKINNLTKSGLFPDEVTAIIKLINSQKKSHADMVIGEDLDETDGWDHFFSDDARCCPGDDFAHFGNNIKSEQRQRNSL